MAVHPLSRRRNAHHAPGHRIRCWIGWLTVAALVPTSLAYAQVYKCTGADGRTGFSDTPCATPSGAPGNTATGQSGVKQELLPQPRAYAGTTSADAIAATCARFEDSKPTDELIKSLPEAQREAVTAALRGAGAGMARDARAQESLKRVSLRIDASRNAILCVPQARAQTPGAVPAASYIVHRIEPNGRMETLQPGAQPLVYNDANDPTSAAARCSSLIVSCFQPKAVGSSIDDCFERVAACPSGRLDPASNCCPQACKDAFRRERARGTDATKAAVKVIFGDGAGTESCIPGMPKR